MEVVEKQSARLAAPSAKRRTYAYRRIADSLRQEIEQGHYTVGDQLPTEKDLESRFSVSRIVIRQAMGLLEREQIIRREPGRGTFVLPRDEAGEAAVPRNGVIGIVSDFKLGFADPFVGPILRELSHCFSGASRAAALFNIWCEGQDPALDEPTLERLADTDGVVVLMPSLAIRTGHVVEQLLRLQKPIVGINFSNPLIDVVVPDFFNGGIQAAEHLLELGHRRLLSLSLVNPSQGWADRVEGFKFAVAKHGGASLELLEVTPTNVHQRIWDFVEAGQPLPSAIFAGTDTNAVKVITALSKYDLLVPRDVSVIGYNDEDVSEAHVAPLTTIRVPMREMANHAARFLERRIALSVNELSGREILFATHLIERGSTAPPAQEG